FITALTQRLHVVIIRYTHARFSLYRFNDHGSGGFGDAAEVIRIVVSDKADLRKEGCIGAMISGVADEAQGALRAAVISVMGCNDLSSPGKLLRDFHGAFSSLGSGIGKVYGVKLRG